MIYSPELTVFVVLELRGILSNLTNSSEGAPDLQGGPGVML